MGIGRRTSLTVASGALLALSTFTVSANTTQGKASGQAPTALENPAARQAPYVQLGRIIDRWVQVNHLAGFTGMAIAPGDSALVVYWKGAAPRALRDLAERSSVAITLRSVPHSLSELDSLERAMMRVHGVQRAGLLSDFSGVEVTATNSAAMSAVEHAAQGAHVRLVSHVGPAAVTPLADRTADVGPFYGGDEIYRPVSTTTALICSTGFEMAHNGDNTSGLSTANHCGEGVAWKTFGGQQLSLGSSVTCSPVTVCQAVDTIPITFGNALPNNDYAPQVWIGAYNSSTATPVIGQGSAIVNQALCIDGGYSGEVCGNTVQSVNNYIQESGYTTMTGPGFWTTLATHMNAAGEGDSGSPVIDPTASGAVGYGTATVGDTNDTATCSGNPSRTGVKCYWRIFSMDLGHVLTGIGAYLVTAPNNHTCSNVEAVALKTLALSAVLDASVC